MAKWLRLPVSKHSPIYPESLLVLFFDRLAIHNTTKKFGIQGTQVAFVDTSVKATKESQYTWTSNASDTSSYVTNCTV